MEYVLWNIILLLCCLIHINYAVYLNKWAVKIDGGIERANDIAKFHGFTNLGNVGSLENYYLFEHHEVTKRSVDPSHHHHNRLQNERHVSWVEQQVVKRRVKRDYHSSEGWSPHLNDPLWPKQWYLHGGATGGYDMNVIGAWERGYTGKGVVVTILDDGIEYKHSDLQDNYDKNASYDINGDDTDPTPRYDSTDENRHGTRCAGEVAALVNNSVCGAGVAFNSKIGGVRMLDGDVSDFVEATALSLNPQHIDIYSASWGPDDNGRVVDGPAGMAKEAFIQGVLKGRNGKGSIFVWASGNGGSSSDSCSCDGYTNSIFTLSVSSASEHGNKPWYLEECPSTLTTTYSSGENYRERKIVTTDLHNKCTEAHTGTSASAPLAAGICALALEANPDLTWRDMQYIVLMTSRTEPLMEDGDWTTNGVGRKVSHKYGYGMMDATAMVELAERWTTVPEANICISKVLTVEKSIDGGGITVDIDTDGCEGTTHHVNYLEHVQAKIKLEYSRRGDLHISLVSPNGTRSSLLPRRKNDYTAGDFDRWPFMSVFYWGENPSGTWKLIIENTGSVVNRGELIQWQLILYGTETQPVEIKPAPDRHPPPPPIIYPKDKGNLAEKEETKEPALDNTSEVNKPPDIDYKTTDEVESTQDFDTEDGGKSEWDFQEHSLECHIECVDHLGCSGPTATDCITCKHVRLGFHGACMESCPYNGYEVDGICLHCIPPCSSCKGPDPSADCLTCQEGYYLLENTGQCVEACPPGYYLHLDVSREEHVNTCRKCDYECETCEELGNQCVVCRDGFQTEGTRCVVQCSPHEFRDSLGRCELCDPSCEMCVGSKPSNCIACSAGFYYQNGSCVTQCDSGFYLAEHQDITQCKRCHVSCETCSGGSADACQSCVSPMTLVKGMCQEDCPAGQYEDKSQSCQPCDDTCETCRGPLSTDCFTCPPQRYLEGGSCITQCSEGFYEVETQEEHGGHFLECHSCHSTCATCSGEAPSHCQSCKEGLFFSSGECRTECREDMYEFGRTCESCHRSCRSCSGPLQSECTLCKVGQFLYDGQCMQACPDGFYVNGQKECRMCHMTCATCLDGEVNRCTSCKSGYIFNEGECVKDVMTCRPSEYFSGLDGGCHSCDETCASCDAPGPSGCLSCNPPRALRASTHQCLLCCSIGVRASCCHCDSHTGECRGEKLASPTDTELGYATLTPSSAKLNRSAISSRPDVTTRASLSPLTIASLDNYAVSKASSPWKGVLRGLIVLSIFSILLFFLIFGLLQARSNERLCWRPKYEPVPMYYHNGFDKLTLTKDDLDDEDEIYSSA